MVVRPQRILSLCAGYGGIELGLQIAGVETRPLVYVEREAYAAANLVARMENKEIHKAPIWDCVDTFDAKPIRGMVDAVVGGYPCTSFSVAGKREGHDGSANVWPHFARIIRECEPQWCFFENVANHLRLGFREVAEELRSMGYRVAAVPVTAAEVGAPQKRERLFILADSGCSSIWLIAKWYQQNAAERRNTELNDNSAGFMADSDLFGCQTKRGPSTRRYNVNGCCGETVADTDNKIKVEVRQRGRDVGRGSLFPPGQDQNDPRWGDWPWPNIEPEVRQRFDGHPYWVDELRLNGGGVVPLQAAYAFGLLALDMWGDE